MRKCPFCNAEIDADHPYLGISYNENVEKYMLHHFCHKNSSKVEVCVSVYGDTKEEVIERWNGHCEEHPTE